MLHARVLLTFVGLMLGCALALGCASAPAAPVTASRSREVRHAPGAAAAPEPARALTSVCRATPSTVYGDEPVVFEVQARSADGLASLLLRDERGQAVAQARAPVPGRWQPPLSAEKSGDFTLEVVASGVSCMVTVNRELSRATEPAR